MKLYKPLRPSTLSRIEIARDVFIFISIVTIAILIMLSS